MNRDSAASISPPPNLSLLYTFFTLLQDFAIVLDACGTLRRNDLLRPFFLEYERRAVRPVTMAQRLAPYLRYHSSHRPADDHGHRPLVLVVFDDPVAPTHFLEVARREMLRLRVPLPLLTSHRELVDREGPLGPAWLAPAGDFQPVEPLNHYK